jgi:hypothetical protein
VDKWITEAQRLKSNSQKSELQITAAIAAQFAAALGVLPLIEPAHGSCPCVMPPSAQ